MSAHLRNGARSRLSVSRRQAIGRNVSDREKPWGNRPNVGHRNVVEMDVEVRRLVAVGVRVRRSRLMASEVRMNLRVVEVGRLLYYGGVVQDRNGVGGPGPRRRHVLDHRQRDR